MKMIFSMLYETSSENEIERIAADSDKRFLQ